MKKNSMIAGLLLTATIMISCTKESAIVRPALVAPSPVQPQSVAQAVKIVSPWFNPEFTTVYERGSVYLKAHRVSETPLNYERSTHVELAFVKFDFQSNSVARRLPAIVSCSHIIANEFCEIKFGIGDTGCDVTIENADRNSLPVITTNPFPGMQIRYLVIPKTIFERLSIDWDDYTAVAQALNI